MSSDAVTLPPAAPKPATGLKRTVPGAAPASRAVQDGLELVVTRAAVVFRGAWCAVTPLLALAVGGPATRSAPRAVAVAVVVGWGVTVWLACRHRRTLPVWLVTADAVLYAGLLLAIARLLPGPLVGESGGWVFGSATVSILIAAWRLSRWGAAAVTAMEMSAYLGGLALGGALGSPSVVTNLITYPVQLVLGLMVIGVMRRSARAADGALERLGSAHRQSAVDEARLRDRQARRLALHDTVLTTLTAVARGGLAGHADVIRRRCGEDLDSLSTTRSTGPREEPVPLQELVARVRGEAEARGLVAGVTARSPALMLRADVAVAMADAAREALSNVERHAGVSAVDIEVDGDAGGVVMTVADAGVGFDPARTRPGSTGLAHSIRGRLEGVGGSASVASAPGHGTVVTLGWSATSSGHDDEFGLQLRRLLAGAYTGGVAKAVVSVALLWHLFSLSMLVTNWQAYRSGGVVVAAWVVMLVVGIVLAVRVTGRGGVNGPQAAAATAVLLAATLAVIASCDGPGLLNHANWVTGGFGWFIVILAVYRPAWEAAAGLAVLAAADLVAVAVRFHGALSAVAFIVGTLFSIGILQLGTIAVFRILNGNVDTAAGAVRTVNALEIDRAARAAIVQDRAARDHKLDRDLFPLVRGLADGSLDPGSAATRQRCDVAAGVLRALITHDDGTTAVAPLDAAARASDAAQAHGVVPDLRIDPDIEQVPAAVRDRLLSILTATLAMARPGEASLTMHGSAAAATGTVCLPVAVPAEALHRQASAAASELAATVGGTARADLEQLGTDRVWLQIAWER